MQAINNKSHHSHIDTNRVKESNQKTQSDDSPLTKIKNVALAIFAIIALGIMTGHVGLSILASVVILGVSFLWVIEKVLSYRPSISLTQSTNIKTRSSPTSKEIDKTEGSVKILSMEEINKKTKEAVKESIEKDHHLFINALGGQDEFDRLPVVNLKHRYDDMEIQLDPAHFHGPISKGIDSDGIQLVMFKVKSKKGCIPFMSTFARQNGKHWLSNARMGDYLLENYVESPLNFSQVCFPHDLEGSLVAIRQLFAGTHPQYELVRKQTETPVEAKPKETFFSALFGKPSEKTPTKIDEPKFDTKTPLPKVSADIPLPRIEVID